MNDLELITALRFALYCNIHRKLDPDHPSEVAKREWDLELLAKAEERIRDAQHPTRTL